MSTRLYIDVTTGEVRAAKGAAPLAKLAFSSRDILPLELVFTAGGAEVTSAVLAGNATLLAGLRAQPGTGKLLALADTYTLAGEVASTVLSLNTEEVIDYLAELPVQWASGSAYFEVQVLAADESTRQVMAQLPAAIRRRVVGPGDIEPPPLEVGLYVLKTTYNANFADPTTAPSFGASAWRTALIIDQVDNTSDADKPVSVAQAAADTAVYNAARDRSNHTGTQAQSTVDNLVTDLAAKAPLASPALTGTPTAPTAAVDTSTTQLATTAFAKKEADDAQAFAVQRINHTGTQPQSSVENLVTDLSAAAGAAFARAIVDAITAPDGLTANRRAEWALGQAGNIKRFPATLPVAFDVPTANPSSKRYIAAICASGTTAPDEQANSLSVYIDTTGALVIDAEGAIPGTDFRRYTYAGFRAAYSGRQLLRSTIIFSAGDSTTPPTPCIEGVDLTASFVATTGGAAPNWLDANLDTTLFVAGHSWPRDQRIVPHAPVTQAWTVAQSLLWAQTGRMPALNETDTGNADRSLGGAPSNASGQHAMDSFSADSATGFTAQQNDEGGNGMVCWLVTGFRGIGYWKPGRSYIVEYDLILNSGSIGSATVLLTASGSSASSRSNTVALAAGVKQRAVITPTSGSNEDGWCLAFKFPNVCNVTVANVRVVAPGPVFKPIFQPILVVADAGENRIAGRLVSLVALTAKRDWIVQGKTSLANNQQLLGGTLFPASGANCMIDTAETNGASTATIYIGSASGGSQYKASGALVSGRNRHALVTPVVASGSIWVNSDTSDELTHTIRGHIVD